MKLYYARGTCSLTPHILLRETGLPFSLEQVDTATHKTAAGVDFHTLNPKGYVPLLELDDGERLTEVPVISQYICDLAERTDLMPASGTMARYRVMEWQSYISSEIHKAYGPLFGPLAADVKSLFAAGLRKKYEWLDSELQGRSYLTGETFTAADAYLFNVTRWAKYVHLETTDLINLAAFVERVRMRPAAREAAKVEGIPG